MFVNVVRRAGEGRNDLWTWGLRGAETLHVRSYIIRHITSGYCCWITKVRVFQCKTQYEQVKSISKRALTVRTWNSKTVVSDWIRFFFVIVSPLSELKSFHTDFECSEKWRGADLSKSTFCFLRILQDFRFPESWLNAQHPLSKTTVVRRLSKSNKYFLLCRFFNESNTRRYTRISIHNYTSIIPVSGQPTRYNTRSRYMVAFSWFLATKLRFQRCSFLTGGVPFHPP